MAGLLNPNPQASAQPTQSQDGAVSQDMQGSSESLNDPILKQIEQGIEEKIPPEMKDKYLAIVVSGMQIMFSKETSALLDKTLDMQGDMVSNLSQGIAKLMVLIYNESKKGSPQGDENSGMDVRMAVPAAISLLCQALDYAEHAKGVKVTPEMAAAATKQTMLATLKMFGISSDQISKTIQAGQQGGGAQPDQSSDPNAAPQGAAPPMMGA